MTTKAEAKVVGGSTGIAPAGAVALRSLTMRNVLSFGAETTVELGPLNILIGPNGCGKSNLMDVVALLKAAAGGELSDEFHGSGLEWVWKGAERDKNGGGLMQVESIWGGGEDLQHAIGIRVGKGLGGYAVQPNEFIAIKGDEWEDKIERGDRDSFRVGDYGRLSLLNPSVPTFPILAELGKTVKDAAGFTAVGPQRHDLSALVDKGAQVYRSRQVGRLGKLNPMRRPSGADMPNGRLMETLDNFAVVLNRVYGDPECKNAIDEKMRELYDDARGIYFNVANNAAAIALQEAGQWLTPASHMSDGMLNWLFLLTVLLDPDPPALVCIDEPETGLHTDMLPTLGQMLIDASARMQLIVTTHSDMLVDCFTDHPEAVVVCDKADGVTQMKRLRAEDFQEWKEEGLGMAWIRGAIGGKRW